MNYVSIGKQNSRNKTHLSLYLLELNFCGNQLKYTNDLWYKCKEK